MCTSAVKNTSVQKTVSSENECDHPSKVSPSQQTAIADEKTRANPLKINFKLRPKTYLNFLRKLISKDNENLSAWTWYIVETTSNKFYM
jgi:hypothetical protein